MNSISKHYTLFFSFLFTICCSKDCLAISDSALEALSNDRVWRLLIGYGYDTNSDVLSPSFYLDKNSDRTPLSELKATLKGFESDLRAGDRNLQCKFRGRYVWLSSKLDLEQLSIKSNRCPGYHAFLGNGKVDSLSLVFATGYLGNPASYYGHMLFKVNGAVSGRTKIQQMAINYGAKIPADDGMATYVLKGIFGRYDSTFTQKEFYYHMHIYLDGEQRDLWEYHLNLPKFEKQLLAAHAWEMLGVRHRYYFLNRNCSYRMAELIDLISDQSVNRPQRPWDAPQSILQRMTQATIQGEPVVKRVEYIPSRQSHMQNGYRKLERKMQNFLSDLISTPESLEGNKYLELSEFQKISVLDVLMDYYRFSLSADELLHNADYQRVLVQRIALSRRTRANNFSAPEFPHLGHAPSYLSVGYVSNQSQSNSVRVRLRPAYFDRLDYEAGHGGNGALSMMDTVIRVDDDQIRLEQLSLVSIENFGGKETGLPGDKNNAWTLFAGGQRLSNDCDSCFSTSFYGETGRTYGLLNHRAFVTALVGGGYLGKSFSADALYASVRLSASYKMDSRFSLSADVKFRDHFFGSDERFSTAVNARYVIARNIDLRLTLSRNETTEFVSSIGFYW